MSEFCLAEDLVLLLEVLMLFFLEKTRRDRGVEIGYRNCGLQGRVVCGGGREVERVNCNEEVEEFDKDLVIGKAREGIEKELVIGGEGVGDRGDLVE